MFEIHRSHSFTDEGNVAAAIDTIVDTMVFSRHNQIKMTETLAVGTYFTGSLVITLQLGQNPHVRIRIDRAPKDFDVIELQRQISDNYSITTTVL